MEQKEETEYKNRKNVILTFDGKYNVFYMYYMYYIFYIYLKRLFCWMKKKLLVIQTNHIPFWDSLSLEELAKAQGVKPATDLDSISAVWENADELDKMLDFILSERESRRQEENRRIK